MLRIVAHVGEWQHGDGRDGGGEGASKAAGLPFGPETCFGQESASDPRHRGYPFAIVRKGAKAVAKGGNLNEGALEERQRLARGG